MKFFHIYNSHSDYTNDIDNISFPNIVECRINTDQAEIYCIGSHKTFTISNVLYQVEEGMTWEAWINSSYNFNGYKISEGDIYDSTMNYEVCTPGGVNVHYNSIIISGYNYVNWVSDDL